jgi:hypothetical protein
MNTPVPEWLDGHIWPQIHTMMLNDAYFKLMGQARELTGEFNGPIASLIEVGHVTCQTLAVRRLCDTRKDVISLHRALIAVKSEHPSRMDRLDALLTRLDDCDHVCALVNNYIAHTGNPLRRPNLADWNLQVSHLNDAHRAICETAIILDRDVLRRTNPVKIIPVPQYGIMDEFAHWVPSSQIPTLWKFWHAHTAMVDSWIPAGQS